MMDQGSKSFKTVDRNGNVKSDLSDLWDENYEHIIGKEERWPLLESDKELHWTMF